MNHVLALDGREIALELHRLLKELDPARWRADLQQRARARVAHIVELLREGPTASAAEDGLASLHARPRAPATMTPAFGRRSIRAGFVARRVNTTGYSPSSRLASAAPRRPRCYGVTVARALTELARSIEAHLPDGQLKNGEARAAWSSFRAQLTPVYERLAQGLRDHAIHVPELRPTNYVRNLFHLGSAVVALVLLETLSATGIIWAAGAFAVAGWTMELTRKSSSRVNDFLMRGFGPVAHPHEHWRINSATWFCTALLILALAGAVVPCAVALVVLGFADPAAALVGRRFGTIKLMHGRSLQGSLTFLAVGAAVALGLLVARYGFGPGAAAVVALGAALPATVVELVSRSVDDNLSIPLTAAAGAWVSLTLLGTAA